jgi:hypothetical protein
MPSIGSKKPESSVSVASLGSFMTLTLAAALANVLNFVIFMMIAVWYVAPWLAARNRAEALAPLLWVQAFRHVALQIFSAQKFGFAVTDGARDQIVAGDLIGMALALAAIVALRYRSRIAAPLIWLLIAETAIDLVYTAALGMREQLYASASNVTWLIVSFYVPLLWVSLGLIVWQMYSRGNEPLTHGPSPRNS